MDYEKKYKEALERARELVGKWIGKNKNFYIEDYSYIFPELKESEDERIRKEMIEVIKNEAHEFPSSVIANKSNSWIAWLEKQGKKSNIHQDAEDDLRRQSTIRILEYARSLDAYNQYGKESINKDIAWLEKQGEQKETNLVEILKNYPRETELYSPLYGKLWLAEVDEKREIVTCYKHRLDEGCTRAILEQEDTVSFYSNGTTGLPDFSISKDCMLFLYDIEKQDEQNPVNKVEPKFRVGDWIIKNDGNPINIDYSCCEITKVENGNYTIESIYGYKGYNTFETFEKDYHLWTIKDAKDGDVLAEDSCMFIIEKMKSEGMAIVYCCLFDDGDFDLLGSTLCFDVDSTYPATKEQRDLLFQKMHEAGYEWDFEKKELKKIEQASSWSEDDEVGLDDAMWKIEQAMGNLWRAERWLKSVKERMKGE